MRKLLALALSAAVMLCASCKAPEAKSDRLSIITTIYPAYDFAVQVFGDTADITLLLKPGMEAHTYDPSARDIVKINDCDLFIYNGGESDEWVENILASSDDINTFRMMDCIEALQEETPEGMQETADHDDDDHAEEYDEHIWTSPKNAAKIVDGIRFFAKELLPEKAEHFDACADEYIAKINDLDRRFSELLSGEERYFVFGDRFPLLYFFREYSLNYYAAFPGCGSEVEPSAGTIAFLTEKLKSEQTVGTVFYIELSNHKLADVLAEETGLPTAEFHTCHNIAAADFEAGETYVSLMERNYNTLKSALGRE